MSHTDFHTAANFRRPFQARSHSHRSWTGQNYDYFAIRGGW